MESAYERLIVCPMHFVCRWSRGRVTSLSGGGVSPRRLTLQFDERYPGRSRRFTIQTPEGRNVIISLCSEFQRELARRVVNGHESGAFLNDMTFRRIENFHIITTTLYAEQHTPSSPDAHSIFFSSNNTSRVLVTDFIRFSQVLDSETILFNTLTDGYDIYSFLLPQGIRV